MRESRVCLQGTVCASEDFDAGAVAETLRDAMTGLGKSLLISLLR